MKQTMAALLALLLALACGPALAESQVTTIVGDHWDIPATITFPQGEGPFPFVVMYHGTGSSRDEAGGGYALLADALAEAGIASARFDFAGNGDSMVDYVEYTLTGGMEDGNNVIAYMQAQDRIDPDRVGIVGWSQGGTVAMLTAARNPYIRSLVTWAGAVDMSGFMASQYEEAKHNGYAVIEFDWREPLNLSIDWYDEARHIDIAQELAQYDGAVLAIAGSEDTVVPLSDLDVIMAAVPTEAKQSHIIAGADHTFDIFSGSMEHFDELLDKTVQWFENTL